MTLIGYSICFEIDFSWLNNMQIGIEKRILEISAVNVYAVKFGITFDKLLLIILNRMFVPNVSVSWFFRIRIDWPLSKSMQPFGNLD